MKRPLIKGGFIGFLLGLIAGAALLGLLQERLYSMGRPMGRIAEAAEVSDYTYTIYLHAPYPVAEEFLDREYAVLQRLAEESTDDPERENPLEGSPFDEQLRSSLGKHLLWITAGEGGANGTVLRD